jgi:UDP-glucuronate 4-epimerase
VSTYLVTGVAGFIASRTAALLLAQGHRVVGVDNLNDYYDVRLKDHRLAGLLGEEAVSTGADGCRVGAGGNFFFFPVDVEDFSALERLFREIQFDAVFNLAARAGVRASLENPGVYLSTNTGGALNVLECQRRYGVRKLVLASTSSLYAGCPLPFAEDQPVNTPRSPYAASKKAAELLAYTYHHQFGLDVSIVRYFTVFGPAGRPDMSLFRFIQRLRHGQPLEIFGDGRQTRDFTYVDDIARGTILAARPLGYEIINLGGGRCPLSLLDAIAILERCLGQTARLNHQPPAPADIVETQADIRKAARLLEWRPEIEPAEGLRRTVEWHLANSAWLDELRA